MCLEHFEKYEIHCKIYTLLYTKFWRHWRRSGVLIHNFEHISYLVLVFLLLILNRQMPIENFHVLANFQVPKYSLCILSKTVTTRIRLPIFNWCFVYILSYSVANSGRSSVIANHLGLLVGQNRCRFLKMTEHN